MNSTNSAAPSQPPSRKPLRQRSLISQSRPVASTPHEGGASQHGVAPHSPKLGGGSTESGVARRGSATGRKAAEVHKTLHSALSSDEFIRRRQKRGPEGGSENASRGASTAATAPTMNRSRSSSSATSSTASGSTLQARYAAPHPRASRSHSSLSSRQRSRSRSRTSARASPILAAATLPIPPPPTTRSFSSSSCPEPRGATLSVTPTTTEPVMAEVLAEGELERAGRAGGNAAEVLLVELRDGRSVPNSECGDDDGDQETFDDLDLTLVHDLTLPLPPSDLAAPQAIAHALSLPSLSNTPPPPAHSQSHRRPSASRHRTSPPALSTSPGITNYSNKDVSRRYSRSSAMSTSPRVSSPERSLSISASASATRLAINSGPTSPSSSSRPRAPIATSQPRGRSSTTSSTSGPTSEQHSRTPSLGAGAVVEKRRRQEEPTPAPRPPLHTYTSFDQAFGVEPPRSPEGSPTKTESKGWWGRSG